MKKRKSYSIVIRLTIFIAIIIGLQTALTSGLLIKGGVINQATDNSFALFNDKVSNRLSILEGEMKNNWTVFDPYLNNLSLLFDKKESRKEYFQKAINQLIPLLRRSQATGAYIILTDGKEDKDYLPALYLRDYDPVMNHHSDDDIYMVYGPSSIAKKEQIPLDETWQYNFKKTKENSEFIEKTLSNDVLLAHTSEIGYWHKPFRISENDVEVITYSVPIYDQYGDVCGIVGIDVTINYLMKFLPKSELYPQDSLGYLIAFKDKNDNQMKPILISSALQNRFINKNDYLDLSIVDDRQKIYTILNHKGVENIYSSVMEIGVYNYNASFDDEKWYFLGLMREQHLLSPTKKIKNIVFFSIILALILSLISGILISYQMGKPVLKLIKQLRESKKSEKMKLLRTGLSEVDELTEAFVETNNMMIESASRFDKMIKMSKLPIGAYEINVKLKTFFVTDDFFKLMGLSKDKEKMDYEDFIKELELNFTSPYSEDNVYKIESSERYIRYSESTNNDMKIGVILDVTKDILEKQRIKRERDHDSLTGILNRIGFIEKFNNWYKDEVKNNAALVMFDLDNLKKINDSFGHKWGDDYIIMTVEKLKNIDGLDHFILGRRSGDEFFALLYDYPSKEIIIDKIKEFYDDLNSSLIEFPDKKKRYLRVSSGIKWIDDNSKSFDDLLHEADKALYEAKNSGKGVYKIYS